MATNGSSARQWLAEHGQSASPEELQRIRNAIATKLDRLPEEHPEEDGLLEALDVMDEWQEARNTPSIQASSPLDSDRPALVLDTSPLTPDIPPASNFIENPDGSTPHVQSRCTKEQPYARANKNLL